MTAALRNLVRRDETFSVGDPLLDEQHEGLFALLEELVSALERGDDAGLASGVVRLLEDCSSHFSTEEAYLEGNRYPDLVKQRVQHQFFVRRLTQLSSRLAAGTEKLDAEGLDRLASWLQGHIFGLDREYAEYFRLTRA